MFKKREGFEVSLSFRGIRRAKEEDERWDDLDGLASPNEESLEEAAGHVSSSSVVDTVLNELEIIRAQNEVARQALEAERQRLRQAVLDERRQHSRELRAEYNVLKRLDESGWECVICSKRNAFRVNKCCVCDQTRSSDDDYRVRVAVPNAALEQGVSSA